MFKFFLMTINRLFRTYFPTIKSGMLLHGQHIVMHITAPGKQQLQHSIPPALTNKFSTLFVKKFD